jgi:hypothetical protein
MKIPKMVYFHMSEPILAMKPTGESINGKIKNNVGGGGVGGLLNGCNEATLRRTLDGANCVYSTFIYCISCTWSSAYMPGHYERCRWGTNGLKPSRIFSQMNANYF